ncbi:hypothetical protein [Paenibacillus polymyxa]|uniref:hypothetical protein n=1 Tax=Paenibacillus polymyxa TaxID=1406 RepID=UPI002AB503A1|nr:hypothetical protein [Paenibacillus polymyxa]MDY8021271.1 hypothetical protein [Paenibacillus polymyxa]
MNIAKGITLELIKNNDVRSTYVDDLGYKYELSLENLKVIERRNSKPAKFFRNNPYTHHNILLYIGLHSNGVTLLSDKVNNAKETLRLRCNTHGEFNKSWNELKNGQFCPECGKIIGNNNRKNKFEDVKCEFISRGYELKSTEYADNNTKMKYVCNNHKFQGEQFITWGNLISGKGCPHCSKERTREAISKTHEQFIEELSIVNDSYIVKSKYISSSHKVDILCTKCNSKFSSKASHLLAGHMGCNCKSSSLGEDKIREYLDANNISYTQQYRIEDCRNKRALPFDFAIFSDTNELAFLIEFNGKQHYHPTSWSSSKNDAEERFSYTQKNDRIKQNFCKKKEISLITIPYWKFGEIEDILIRIKDHLSKDNILKAL